MSDRRFILLVAAVLGLVAVAAGVLLIRGPKYVEAEAVELFRDQQQVEAAQLANLIGARMDAVEGRLELPAASSPELGDEPSEATLEAFLDNWTHEDDRRRGITLFVHDREGRVLAVAPAAQGTHGEKFEAHIHDVEPALEDSQFGICQKCLNKMGELSLRVPMTNGLLIAANIDAEKLARSVFGDTLRGSNSYAELATADGAPIYETGEIASENDSHVQARAPVPDTNWRVRVAAPRAEIAPQIDRATRTISYIAGGLILGVFVGLVGLLIWRRQRMKRRLQQERALAHQDKLATLGTLSASVAHEIRNTIAVAKGSLQLVREDLEGESRADVDQAIEAVDRLAGLAGDLSGFAGKGTDEDGIRIEDVIDSARRIVEPKLKHNATITTSVADDPRVDGDSRALSQVLVNLFLNAHDASEADTKCEVDVRARRDNGRAQIVVEDNGPGIDQDVLDNIFEAFFSTKGAGSEGGTGLGLWLSRRIIEAHQGSIRAQNRPDGGVRFTIELPLTSSASTRLAADSPDRLATSVAFSGDL